MRKTPLLVLAVVIVAASAIGIAALSRGNSTEPGFPVPVDGTDTASTPVAGGLEPGIDADPNYQEELSAARIPTGNWTTDFSRYTVDYREISSGGVGRDGIPPIDDPSFVAVQEADGWLGDKEPVILVKVNGEARAYPIQILTWHEIVNDEIGGIPVSVTFCPLCNSAIAFDRRFEGAVLDFGVSGNLRNSDLIMYDRQTQSWWQQFTGEGIVGTLAGRKLTILPASIIAWSDFKEANPDSRVLSRSTGFSRRYGENPYSGYDRVDNPPFLFRGDMDSRLLPKERIAAVSIDGVDAAYPFSLLEQERVVHDTVGGQEIVLFFKPGTVSALDRSVIVDSKDVGSTGVFKPVVDGRKLTFSADGDGFVDDETASRWNILGESVGGALAGSRLAPVVHANHFWFAWAAFKPDTVIYQGGAAG